MYLNKNSPLACAGLAIFCHYSLAVEPPEVQAPSGNLTFVGSKGRIGIGYDSMTKLRGDVHWVVVEDASSAWISEGWVSGAAGGLKLNYHWAPMQESDTAASHNTYKLFAAMDRNEQFDGKLTLGAGLESENLFFGATLSTALTGRRGVGGSSSAATVTLRGAESDGREYLYDVVTTTDVRLFERPYDYGVGLRVGRYFDQALLRVSGGLDYEWGADASHQTTVSVGLEKFIANTPHSFSVDAQAYQKSGPFEAARDDQRVYLMYRYALGGKGYRERREFRMVQAPVQAVPAMAEDKGAAAHSATDVAGTSKLASTASVSESKPGIAKRMVKTTATMLSDAFFVFDSDVLTADARKALEPIVALLRKQAYTGNILLTGHTCDLGPAKYNLLLSERRARSVKKYLVEAGAVPADLIVTEGKGNALPRFPNVKASRFKNRRVDLQFVTFSEKLEDVEVPVVAAPTAPAVVAKEAPRPTTQVEWKREYIDSEPAWLRRALHNTLPHKQTVDVYRQQEREVKVATGDKRYVNRAPKATMDAFSVNQDTTTALDVLSNDTDPDGNPLKVASVTTPANGSASISAGKVSYTPATGFVGVDTFTYTITDDKGATGAAQVTVTVLSTNRPPVAQNDAFAINQDTATALDVLANDSDPDANPLKITTVSTPAHGSASINGGKVTYTPVAGFVGVDSFTYTVADDKGATASAQATITVKSTNRAPIAKDDVFSVNQDTIGQLDVLANDNDPDGNPLTITSVSAPAHGVASVSGGKVNYKPLPGYVGADSFSYTIADDKGATSSAVANITVKSTNRAPVAKDDGFSLNQDTIALFDVLANDSDPDGNPLTITTVSTPAHGVASVSGGKVSYQPLPGYVGVDSFSYTIADDKGATGSAIANITVRSTNRQPVAVEDTYYVNAISATALNVLGNDFDPDGDALTIVSFTQPSTGSIKLGSNGSLVFTPVRPFLATQFSYTVSDGKGGTATAIVTLIDP